VSDQVTPPVRKSKYKFVYVGMDGRRPSDFLADLMTASSQERMALQELSSSAPQRDWSGEP